MTFQDNIVHTRINLADVPNWAFRRQANHALSIPNTFDLRILDDVSSGNAFLQNSLSTDEKLLTFMDEKPDKRSFMIVGVTTVQSHINIIAKGIREYKKMLIPDLHPNHWYLKADGNYKFINNTYNGIGSDKADAIARWAHFALFLDFFRKLYCLHISYTLINDTAYSSLNRRNKLPTFYLATFRGIKKSLFLFHPKHHDLYIDKIDSRSYKKLQEEIKHDNQFDSINEIAKEEFDTDIAQVMQFVDMLTYFCSRFLFPPHSLSVLLGFEKYAMLHASGMVLKTGGNIEITKEDTEAHVILSNILHQLRYSILHNFQLQDGIECGSVKKCKKSSSKDISNKLIDAMFDFAHVPSGDIDRLKKIFFEAGFY